MDPVVNLVTVSKTGIKTTDLEEHSDDVISDIMKTEVTCFLCDDSYCDLTHHVREVHKVTKNVDILIEFIIDKERGNTRTTLMGC